MSVDPAEWLREFSAARAGTATPVRGGTVVRSATYPAAHDHNSVHLWESADATTVVAVVEAALGDCAHRRVVVDGAARTTALAAVLDRAGYEREEHVLMVATRPVAPDRPSSAGVVELSVAERIDVSTATWAHEAPDLGADVHRQLGERIRTATTVARCTFLAVRGADGRIEATADLYVRDEVAQVEEVMTGEAFRDRGHASRMVRAALERAAAPTVLIVADADDWPRRLYDRLGFDVVGERSVWSRTADGAPAAGTVGVSDR